MDILQQTLLGRPAWQRRSRSRLAVSMCIAAAFLVAVLLLQFSPPEKLSGSPINVHLLSDKAVAVETDVEPAQIDRPDAQRDAPESLPVEPISIEAGEVRQADSLLELVETTETPTTDWYAGVEKAAQETVAAANHVDSMHAGFEQKRRLAIINFPASKAPVKKPIWENVETDQMGRKILVSGDCHRVLEEWRATQFDFHRDFGQ